MFNLCMWPHISYIETWFAYFQIRKLRDRSYNVLYLHWRSLSFQTVMRCRNRLKGKGRLFVSCKMLGCMKIVNLTVIAFCLISFSFLHMHIHKFTMYRTSYIFTYIVTLNIIFLHRFITNTFWEPHIRNDLDMCARFSYR